MSPKNETAVMFAAAKILARPKEVKVLQVSDLFELTFDDKSSKLTKARTFSPTHEEDFHQHRAYGFLSSPDLLYVWILKMGDKEKLLEELRTEGRGTTTIRNPTRRSLGNEKMSMVDFNKVLEKTGVKDSHAASKVNNLGARKDIQEEVFKRHFEHDDASTPVPPKKPKLARNDEGPSSEHSAGNISPSVPATSNGFSNLYQDEEPIPTDFLGLQCPGTCTTAVQLKGELKQAICTVKSLRESNDDLKKVIEDLKKTQHSNQEVPSIEDVAKKLAHELSRDLLDKLPAAVSTSQQLQPKGCSLINRISGMPLGADMEKQPTKVHVGDGVFVPHEAIIRLNLKVDMSKRVDGLLKAMWPGQLHLHYLSEGKNENQTPDKLPITSDNVVGICGILTEMTWPKNYIVNEREVRDWVRRLTNRARDAFKFDQLSDREKEEKREKKRTQVKARREMVRAEKGSKSSAGKSNKKHGHSSKSKKEKKRSKKKNNPLSSDDDRSSQEDDPNSFRLDEDESSD